jgi:GNAT superfamily N-acetyltransferase
MQIIRPATPDDTDACVGIVEGLPDFFSAGVPEQVRLDLARFQAWVLADAGQVVAFTVADRRSSRTAEIAWAAVAASRRARGLGTALVSHVLSALHDDGVQVVEVKTLDGSAGYGPYQGTCLFWENCGFVQIDTIDPLPGWQPGNPSAIYVAALAPTRPPL